MNFLKNNKRISFRYGEKSIWEQELSVKTTESENSVITEYRTADGLKFTNIAKKYDEFGAYEWVTYFENTGSAPTEIISELCDCNIEIPISIPQFAWTAYIPEDESLTKVLNPIGSLAIKNDFALPESNHQQIYEKPFMPLYENTTLNFKTSGGRSSEESAPFFNIASKNGGLIFAIGWSGQWNCEVSGKNDTAHIKTKIEDSHFRLLPGEKIRTSSFVMMHYDGAAANAHNKWRRLIKKHFSLIGSDGRDAYGPLCFNLWGGMTTKGCIERINAVENNNIPFEYVWMDAGWYGMSEKDSPDEFEGDWPLHTGDWRINTHIHPDSLLDVSKKIHEAGMKFLLWFEPERVIYTTPIAQEHPEYFLRPPKGTESHDLLLNLGNEDAFNYCFKVLCEHIETLGIDCYRQDFNMSPLEYWRQNDSDDRIGITEIKHINGLYRLWDKLLERFPHLIIDNCASGGRRIDIETMRRSIPLWRSDYQCPANFKTEVNQYHGASYGTWMPYSGTGTGRTVGDTYRFRSAYAPALATNYMYSEKNPVITDRTDLEWIKKCTEEYLKVRPYLSCDMYPLIIPNADTAGWLAVQYDRPDENDGVLQVFRRENSPYPVAHLKLESLKMGEKYILTDADDGNKVEFTGGTELKIEISEKRTAKLYFYKKIK